MFCLHFISSSTPFRQINISSYISSTLPNCVKKRWPSILTLSHFLFSLYIFVLHFSSLMTNIFALNITGNVHLKVIILLASVLFFIISDLSHYVLSFIIILFLLWRSSFTVWKTTSFDLFPSLKSFFLVTSIISRASHHQKTSHSFFPTDPLRTLVLSCLSFFVTISGQQLSENSFFFCSRCVYFIGLVIVLVELLLLLFLYSLIVPRIINGDDAVNFHCSHHNFSGSFDLQ